MYNYLIIPIESGYEVLIFDKKAKQRFRVSNKIEAIRQIELLGLNLRTFDRILSIDVGLDELSEIAYKGA